MSLQWLMTKDAYTFRYRVRNWSHYNQALIARGDITFWIDEAALTTWRNTQARLGSDPSSVACHTDARLVTKLIRGESNVKT